MSTFEWNKIIASVLTAMIVAMVTGIVATFVVRPERLENPVYMPPGAAEGAKAAEAAQAASASAAPKLEPIGPALAKADPTKGEQIAHVCLTCHTFNKGEPNKIGPNLFGVFGGPIAEDRGGYDFSDALKQHDKDKWTPDLLNQWLNGPQDFASGTKMSFPGLPKVQDRADVIAYLATLTPGGEATEKAIVQQAAAAAAKQPPAPAAAKPAGGTPPEAAKPAGASPAPASAGK